ncbi:nickel-responsive transcriptional regulator NikR [Bradyrhizobium sp. STM 3562]|uniref:nickel-responsive transcriptional regulator NikR n=1 Tax=Bradyrhizobium sp. STM 3562 TaxID=578924 RepID=UPI00388EB78A
MERITATLDKDLVQELDRFQKERGYQNRSEALRDLIRAGLQVGAHGHESGACVGALVYVYDHEVRALAKRLTTAQHDHHDLSVATMHVHLDHNSCLEVAVLRGSSAEVRHFSEHVIAERGVRHGRLVVIPVALEAEAHAHGGGKPHVHPHAHVRHTGAKAKSAR